MLELYGHRRQLRKRSGRVISDNEHEALLLMKTYDNQKESDEQQSCLTHRQRRIPTEERLSKLLIIRSLHLASSQSIEEVA